MSCVLTCVLDEVLGVPVDESPSRHLHLAPVPLRPVRQRVARPTSGAASRTGSALPVLLVTGRADVDSRRGRPEAALILCRYFVDIV